MKNGESERVTETKRMREKRNEWVRERERKRVSKKKKKNRGTSDSTKRESKRVNKQRESKLMIEQTKIGRTNK